MQSSIAAVIDSNKDTGHSSYPDTLASCIYEGVVSHQRHQPHRHGFSYKVAMLYLDLSELDAVFSKSRFWGYSRWSPAAFRREKYFGNPNMELEQCVKAKVKAELGFLPSGSVRLLTNLSYFGYLTNPISCYYCFEQAPGGDEALAALLLDVTNTPWGESHAYVLDMRSSDRESEQRPAKHFAKAMHVSPFMPMEMVYAWWGCTPDEDLYYRISNYWVDDQFHEDGPPGVKQNSPADKTKPFFVASVNFKRRALTARSMRQLLLRYPFMTLQVTVGIYWQALRLLIKRVGLFKHPRAR